MAFRYIVERREIWVQAVAVMADSASEAEEKVNNGEGNNIEADGYFVYSGTDSGAYVREAPAEEIKDIGIEHWDE